ncbi:MAG: glycosyltransferase family 4 protein [Deltaproteobacteria bacterium]|jgi:glycosyltransferase involved in cell wall biosynthesis|nr:glycosyltransferase family 4 protein [Deltaproteobacteria bacterium]
MVVNSLWVKSKTHEKPIRIMDFRGSYKGGGGPEKTILNSAAQHDSEKVDVLVTYLRDPSDHEYIIDTWAKSLGIKYVDVPDAKVFDLSCVNKLKHLINEHDIQLIHSHDDKTLLYGWILKKMRPNVRIMYTCHSHAPYTRQDFDTFSAYLRFYLRSKIQIFLMKKFQKPVLTIAHHTKGSLVADGLKTENVEVLHNGIDIEQWQADKGKPVLRQELDIPPDTLVVGTVARIARKVKDLPTFYRVAAEVVKQIPNVKFVIVGEGHGDLLDLAKKEVADLGLSDTIFFTGHRTDLLDIYSSFDIFFMTSRSEGMPNTVLEAMAMELPVVSTKVGGVPEIITDDTMGLLAPIGDVKALGEKLSLLLSDSEKRKKMGDVARQRIEEQFFFANRVRAMEDYYERFVNDSVC